MWFSYNTLFLLFFMVLTVIFLKNVEFTILMSDPMPAFVVPDTIEGLLKKDISVFLDVSLYTLLPYEKMKRAVELHKEEHTHQGLSETEQVDFLLDAVLYFPSIFSSTLEKVIRTKSVFDSLHKYVNVATEHTSAMVYYGTTKTKELSIPPPDEQNELSKVTYDIIAASNAMLTVFDGRSSLETIPIGVENNIRTIVLYPTNFYAVFLQSLDEFAKSFSTQNRIEIHFTHLYENIESVAFPEGSLEPTFTDILHSIFFKPDSYFSNTT